MPGLKCISHNCDNIAEDTVDAWEATTGRRISVPVCYEKHYMCPTCHKKMEINPLNDEVECFTHGAP